jgi:uncharacterized protein
MADYTDLRPPIQKRHFRSAVIDRNIDQISSSIADPELAWLFRNCFPNTLDTTVSHDGGDAEKAPDTFVITGDIAAMWLRDSTAQVWPYLRFAPDDPELAALIAGVVCRQTRCIQRDPYANAFYNDDTLGEWRDDRTAMLPGVHERKWEIDSLAYFLRLSAGYYAATGDMSPYDSTWLDVVRSVIVTLQTEQAGSDETTSPYSFRRLCDFGDSLSNGGRGDPTLRCGLVRSAFRPSDDQCKLPFLIPANAMLVKALRDVVEIIETNGDKNMAAECLGLANEIADGIIKMATVEHPDFGQILAYEIDGYGGVYLMDDANVPSLLSLPYLGFCEIDDPLYQRTRAFCLSKSNPYFASGLAGSGIGSPHTGFGTIWPIAVIMQAMTSQSDEEITACLQLLKTSHAGTGFMHESFDQHDPSKFTREWFAWANTLFGELIIQLHTHRPHLLNTLLLQSR